MNRLCQGAARVISVVLLAVLFASSALAAGSLQHDVVLRLMADGAQIRISDRIVISGHDKIRLDLADWLVVRDISIDGNGIDTKKSVASLSLSLPSRGKHVIEIAAEGTIPAIDLDKAAHRNGSRAVAGSDGIYLPGWENWLPNSAGTTASFRLSIETPSAYRATATGTFKAEDLGAKRNISVFHLDASSQPPSVFVGPYTVNEVYSGDVRLRTYFPVASAGLAEGYLNAAAGYINTFQQQIGPYPFSDFHIVAAPLPVGLGFRNMTYVDQRILRLPFMRGRSLAHEVLHNWWGNGVEADYSTGNWSEGLTTYMADHGLAHRQGPERSREMRLAWLRDYAALPASRDLPVSRFVAKQHDAAQVVGYGKVAFIFHMLRHEIGEDRFTAAIRRFWTRHKFTIAGWRDIRSAFEAETRSDLGWFFDQWIERAGAPQLRLENVETSRESDKHILSFTIAQAPQVYRLNVPVVVTTVAGSERKNVGLDRQRTRVQLRFDDAPVQLHIDPDNTMFRRLLPGEAPPILRDILLDETAETYILHKDAVAVSAARALAGRLLQNAPVSVADGPEHHAPNVPLVVIGPTSHIDRFIAFNGLPPRPQRIVNRGTARVWTTRAPAGVALLLVEAGDAEAIQALARPLPHYRSKSFIVFEGRRAIENGVWPSSEGPLSRRLD